MRAELFSCYFDVGHHCLTIIDQSTSMRSEGIRLNGNNVALSLTHSFIFCEKSLGIFALYIFFAACSARALLYNAENCGTWSAKDWIGIF